MNNCPFCKRDWLWCVLCLIFACVYKKVHGERHNWRPTNNTVCSIYFSFEFSRMRMRFLVSFDEMMIIAPFVSELIVIFGRYMNVSVSRKKQKLISTHQQAEEGNPIKSVLGQRKSFCCSKHLSLAWVFCQIDLLESLLPIARWFTDVSEFDLFGFQLWHVNIPGDSAVKHHLQNNFIEQCTYWKYLEPAAWLSWFQPEAEGCWSPSSWLSMMAETCLG